MDVQQRQAPHEPRVVLGDVSEANLNAVKPNRSVHQSDRHSALRADIIEPGGHQTTDCSDPTRSEPYRRKDKPGYVTRFDVRCGNDAPHAIDIEQQARSPDAVDVLPKVHKTRDTDATQGTSAESHSPDPDAVERERRNDETARRNGASHRRARGEKAADGDAIYAFLSSHREAADVDSSKPSVAMDCAPGQCETRHVVVGNDAERRDLNPAYVAAENRTGNRETGYSAVAADETARRDPRDTP